MNKKICPLLSKVICNTNKYGGKIWTLHEEKCLQNNCGFWTDATKECSIAAMGTIGPTIWDVHTDN